MDDTKIVIVTGGAQGIGRATARQFAAQGAGVVIADINEEAGRQSAGEMGAFFIACDVSKPDQITAMVDETIARFGGVDTLINNAADLSLLAHDDHLLNSGLDVWEETFRADQLSVMVATKAVLPSMIERGGGSIVNVSSVDGLKGDDTRFAYAMAKAAVNMLTEMVATRYGKQGIRCNAVAPGLVLTPPAQASLTEPLRQIFRDHALVPQEGATPEQAAELICFLASDKAAFITGEIIRLDGGLLAHVPHLAAMRSFTN